MPKCIVMLSLACSLAAQSSGWIYAQETQSFILTSKKIENSERSDISEKAIFSTRADTICLISQKSPDKEEYINTVRGVLELAGLSQRLIGSIVFDPKLDNKVMTVINGVHYILEMKNTGDKIALSEKAVPTIGIGSKVRFEPEAWVIWFGNSYRKGGFEIAEDGFRFFEGTEKQQDADVLVFDGKQWNK